MYFYREADVTMDPKVIFIVLIVYFNIVIVYSCKNHKTCHQCITDPGFCVWCASKDPSFDKEPRCRPESSYDPKWCAGSLDTPDKASVFANEKHNTNFSSETGAVVQIKPQLYDVKLRPGQPLKFNFSFQGAKNYPVDLYILLDVSLTMKNIKKSLASDSENIYKTMQSMTEKVNIGFGTFIDKNTQPYTLDVITKEAYSFRHRLNLTSNYKAFETVVSRTNFSHNYDSPESGFDALAQVMACDVGWRRKSRKIIVLLTDSSHHTVGDGRSAGIFQPYDGKCYTNKEGIYTKELEMDYPSVTTLNRLAIEKGVIIIFTINYIGKDNKDIKEYYETLKEAIRGSKTALLSNDDITEPLRESYKEISTNIKLDVVVRSGQRNNFQIKFHPDCTKKDHGDDCKVETGERRDFTGTITLTEYYGKDTEVIDISVQGMTEKLTLNVEVIKCACEEDEENKADNLKYCSGQKLQCGVCICGESRYGSRCMCEKDKISKQAADRTLCLAPGESHLCSENGECECGICMCNKKTNFGQFCECNRNSCPGYNAIGDVVCSGHGDCACSGDAGRKEVCTCHDKWTHRPEQHQLSDCSCHNVTDSCTLNNKTCNGRGQCTCNSCECMPIANWDKRVKQNSTCHLEPCAGCHSLQCSVIQTCVLCHLESKNCNHACDGIVLVDTDNTTEWSVCENQKVHMGCYTKFFYRYDENKYQILLQMQQDINCAESYYMYGGLLLLTLLLAGILTLLAWKCLTHYQDRREFEKFEAKYQKELDMIKPSDNPLYDKPVTTFRNPAFKRSFNS